MVAVAAKPFPNRFKMVEAIKSLGIRNGDMFFRETDTRALGIIPFSALVSKLSQSNFSHASIARVEGDEIYMLEVNDRGVVKERLVDWVDYCVGEALTIYRLENPPADFDAKVSAEIDRFFATDFTYNFNYTYKDPGRYYCTQSVATIYENCGIKLMEPKSIKEVLADRPITYFLFSVINKLVLWTSGMGFSPKDKYYFVGNHKSGLMASPLLKQVYAHIGSLKLRIADY